MTPRQVRGASVDALIERKVAARLAELLPRVTADVTAQVISRIMGGLGGALDEELTYSTRKGKGPPGIRPRVWRREVPTIPGALKAGRWWTVSRRDFEAWRSTRAIPGSSLPSKVASNDASAPRWTPDIAYETATRGGRR